MYILGGFDGRRLNDMSGSWMGRSLAPRWGKNDKDKRLLGRPYKVVPPQ